MTAHSIPAIRGERLSLREKLCFGCGDFASVLYWQTFMVFLPIFYTDVYGISAAAAGSVILFSRLLDGGVDPVVGMLADRTQTRWGKFRPYLLWVSVPLAVMGVLTFTTPHFSPPGKLAWAYGTFMALMILYTAINIPYTAMLGVLTADSVERTSLSSIKFICAYAASTLVSATLLPMSAAFGHTDRARGWQLSFIIYGATAIVFFLITFAGTRERISPSPEQQTTVVRDLIDLVTNGPWIILLFTTIAMILSSATRASMTVHYFKYFVGSQAVRLPFLGQRIYGFESLVSVFNLVTSLASIAGVFLLPGLVSRWGKKTVFLGLFALSITCSLSFYFLRPDQLAAMFTLHLFGSATGGAVTPVIWAMYADIADYAELKKGRRATGLVFSATSTGMKIGFAFGAAASLWLLSDIGYRANAVQTPAVRHGLVLLMSVIPAAFGLISIVIASFYPLTEARMTEVEKALRSRRTGGRGDAVGLRAGGLPLSGANQAADGIGP